MPWASREQNTQFIQPLAIGPVMQTAPILPTPPTTINAGATWDSGVLPSDGYRALAVGATSSQAGTLSVTRYIDIAGLIALDTTPVSQAMTATNAASLTITDNQPFAAFRVQIANPGGSPATVTKFGILMNAA